MISTSARCVRRSSLANRGSISRFKSQLAFLGAMLFSAFIVYDTYMIMNRMGCDDYVIAAIELYLDIINLFLMILQLLGNDR